MEEQDNLSGASTAGGGTDVLGQLLTIGSNLATPFANKLAYGDQGATAVALASERAKYAQVNGSGANDRQAAVNNAATAGTLRTWLFGAPAQGSAPALSGSLMPMLLVLAVGVLAFWFVRKH